MLRNRDRPGFTLMEMIVVTAVIALLAALLVPAVQAIREASRRMDCASRLAQHGRALHNFEQAYGYFPPLHSGLKTPSSASYQSQYSPFSQLLPYLDQAPVFNQINFNDGRVFNTPDGLGPLGRIRIGVFLCPSDAEGLGCNYRVCTGAGAYNYDHFGQQPDSGNGAFQAWPTLIRTADFTDGLSNTIGMSEKIKSPGLDAGWFPRGQFWYSGIADLLGHYPPTDDVVSACGSLSSTPTLFGWHAGQLWLLGMYDYTAYNHAVGPNARIPDCSIHTSGPSPPPWGESDGGVFAARSYHSAGVNCLHMDGAVRFVGDSVDLNVWRALATRNGGENISEF